MGKNAIAFLQDESVVTKFLDTSDKTDNLILLYSGSGSLSIRLHEIISLSKCKVLFKEVPDFSEENIEYKNILLAFMIGQLSAKFTDLCMLSEFPYILPGMEKKRKTSSSINKTTTRRPRNKSSEDISNDNKKVSETVVPTEPTAFVKSSLDGSKYADLSFDEQYDILMNILLSANNGDVDPASHVKKIIDAAKICINENTDIDKALKITCTSSLAVSLKKALKKNWNDLLSLVSVLKDEF